MAFKVWKLVWGTVRQGDDLGWWTAYCALWMSEMCAEKQMKEVSSKLLRGVIYTATNSSQVICKALLKQYKDFQVMLMTKNILPTRLENLHNGRSCVNAQPPPLGHLTSALCSPRPHTAAVCCQLPVLSRQWAGWVLLQCTQRLDLCSSCAVLFEASPTSH